MSELWGQIAPRSKGMALNRAYRGQSDMEPINSGIADIQHADAMGRGSKALLQGLWREHCDIMMRLAQNENCTVKRP